MRATAPASSANLGPGFDCLALALELRCTVEVETADDWNVTTGDNGRLVSFAKALSTTPLSITVKSEIPVGKGLGSSSAVLGALAAAIDAHEQSERSREDLFDIVADAEGHPDNAAATVYGGLVHTVAGKVNALELHPSIAPVVAVPDVSLPTPEARAALPATVPLEVASRTASRLVLLVEALRTGDVEVLRSIGSDELHEPHRIALRPIIGQIMDHARSAGAPFVAISGSGPSVLVLTTVDERPRMSEELESTGLAMVMSLDIATTGVA